MDLFVGRSRFKERPNSSESNRGAIYTTTCLRSRCIEKAGPWLAKLFVKRARDL